MGKARAAGRAVVVNGRSVYVEESGKGPGWVVFEAGQGLGRTCWDAVVPLLASEARLVAYDRAGFGRSERVPAGLGIDDMAADLAALITTVAPEPVVLVAHSMGGLVARCALADLRLRGLLLLDPTPETAPVYDTFDKTAARVDRSLAIAQVLVRFRPLARLLSRNVQRVFTADTYATMLAEDFVPAGIAQTRNEIKAVAAAIPQFRTDPPTPPACPTILLSASRDDLAEHQRRWVSGLPDGQFEHVDSGHFIQAEQPTLVADRIGRLLEGA